MISQPDSELQWATRLQESIGGLRLTQAEAKLYSQFTRLTSGRPGLTSWLKGEEDLRLSDAERLITASIALREGGYEAWRQAMRRAAEILEWLSHPELNPANIPTRLLSSAAYQLAGYPARATGLLAQQQGEKADAHIFSSFLKADSPALLTALVDSWANDKNANKDNSHLEWNDSDQPGVQLSAWVSRQLNSSLGLLCSYWRWGEEQRLSKALQKIDEISKLMSHNLDPYLSLLTKLCAEVAKTFVDQSLRKNISPIVGKMSEVGKIALERYVRNAYISKKTLVWPSQLRGIEKLAQSHSFTLCTPTGSGKTMVAELAILDSLFARTDTVDDSKLPKPLALYLVPSRALAAEVESKLATVLKQVSAERVRVTGLYGGTDWGPMDAWLSANEPTVLICTYEKAEALIRFLGPMFLNRVVLAVIDEAHSIQFDGRTESFRTAENRSLRLESLMMRLLANLEKRQGRVVALSAVASGFEGSLASWITGQSGAVPASIEYRSMRQLVGRLECLPNRQFTIRNDLLDGTTLEFQEGDQLGRPFIPFPFPPYPPASALESAGPEKRLRPYLLWAAMHLAAPSGDGNRHAVLISVPQHIGALADDFLGLLDNVWSQQVLPDFFSQPQDKGKHLIWERCLQSCEDYFGISSREYRLLQKGIVVHHGKMPGLLARLFIQAIEQKVVYLVLATSTLSEGINLPFETVIISSLRRGTAFLTVREFANLAGRAGRPGIGTAGQTLILSAHAMLARNAKEQWSIESSRSEYFGLLEGLRPIQEDQPTRRHCTGKFSIFTTSNVLRQM